jgi:hypothetical protein
MLISQLFDELSLLNCRLFLRNDTFNVLSETSSFLINHWSTWFRISGVINSLCLIDHTSIIYKVRVWLRQLINFINRRLFHMHWRLWWYYSSSFTKSTVKSWITIFLTISTFFTRNRRFSNYFQTLNTRTRWKLTC